jgi:hypothetical protein
MKNILLLCLLLTGLCHAQSNVVSSGGNASSSSGSVSYTVGQIDYINSSGTTGNIHQGVQQPYEIYGPLDVITFEEIHIKVYPNPTTSEIYVELDASKFENGRILLYDQNGKLILGNLISSNKTIMDLNQLSQGSYLIEINSNEKKIANYKIIKN